MSEKFLFVANSKIHKNGLFIKKGVKSGKIIFIIKGEIKKKINKNKKDVFSNPDWINFKKNYWIDPRPPFKFLNHSCNPNSGIKGKVLLYALRDINPGEEITIDYSTIESDPRWFMNCKCGSQNCRGKVRSLQFLPKKVFMKYDPFIPTELKEYYFRVNENRI